MFYKVLCFIKIIYLKWNALLKKFLKIKIVSVIFKISKGSKKDEHLFSQS
jgi:hypothetical protein